MQDLVSASLIELTEALRARSVSALELMEHVLARADATHADLNALVAQRERGVLLAEARAADARIARGEARPLEGIPFGVKDLEDVAGMVTTHGSLAFREAVATGDSVHVARLRAAGGIPVGKTNTPEFGYTAITKNRVFGPSRNPWNLRCTPGGSSGGSAALVAACVLPIATASDGGGSIRIPASFVGAFGLKPSFGRVPDAPRQRWTFGDRTCLGPLTRTVEDAALFMDQVVGPSPADPNSLPHPGLRYLDAVREGLPRGLRIGFSPALGSAVVQSDIAEVVREAAGVFEKLGHSLEEVAGGPPSLGGGWGRWGNFELAALLHGLLAERPEQFGHTFRRGLESAWEMTPELFAELAHEREALNRWCAELFERCDLLITPTVPFDPPPAGGPFPAETEGRAQRAFGVAAFTIPFNLSWHPAATVRAGMSRAGLPVGLQIVGPRHRDDRVLQASRAFERERPWHPHWPVRWSPLA